MTLSSSGNRRLVGWKDIAAYIGKSPRTAQRWEREFGLPVLRIETEHDGQIIFAESEAIEKWLADRVTASAAVSDGPEAPTSEARSWWTPLRRRAVSIAALALVALLVALWTRGQTVSETRGPSWAFARGADASQMLFGTSRDVVLVRAEDGLFRHRAPFAESAGAPTWGRPSRQGSELVYATRDPSGIARLSLRTGELRHARRAEPWPSSPSYAVDTGTDLLLFTWTGEVHLLGASPDASRVIASVPGPVYDAAVDRDRKLAFLPARDSGSVFVVDYARGQVVRKIVTKNGANHIVLSRDGRRGYVTNEYDNSVSCLDLDAMEVLKTVSVERSPIQISLSTDEQTVFVANRDSDSVSVLDAGECEPVRTLPAAAKGSRPWTLSSTADGTRLYVSAYDRNFMVVYDTSTYREVATIRTSGLVETLVPLSRGIVMASAPPALLGPYPASRPQ